MTTWRQVALIGVIAACAVMAVSSIVFIVQGVQLARVSIAFVGGSILTWWMDGVLLCRRRRSGAVLVDLGRPLSDVAMGALAASSMVAAEIWVWQSPYLIGLTVLQTMWSAGLILLILLLSLGGVQIRERGISVRGTCIAWSRVSSYSLDDPTAPTELVIRYRTWITGRHPSRLTVHYPAKRRVAVQQVMAQHGL